MSEPTGETAGVPAGAPEPAAPPERLPEMSAARAGPEPGKSYRNRFLAVYAVLGLVFVGAIAGGIVLYLQSGPLASPAWSTWKPASGTTAKMASEIADHVSSQYKLNAAGAPARRGRGRAAAGDERHDEMSRSRRSRSARRRRATTGSRSSASASAWTDQFCGLGADCAIDQGKPSETRGRLVRREALEVALYTFKFVPAINSVVAFMPPPPRTDDDDAALPAEGQPEGAALAAAQQDADARQATAPDRRRTTQRRRRSTI